MENKDGQKEEQPIEFTKCPNCGGTEFFFEAEVAKAKASGHLGPQMQCAGIFPNHLLVLSDPTRVVLGTSSPGFMFNLDICTKCGTVLARKITPVKAVAQAQMPGQIPGGMPRMMPPNLPFDGNFRNPKRS